LVQLHSCGPDFLYLETCGVGNFAHARIVRSKSLSNKKSKESRGYPPRGDRSAGRERASLKDDEGTEIRYFYGLKTQKKRRLDEEKVRSRLGIKKK